MSCLSRTLSLFVQSEKLSGSFFFAGFIEFELNQPDFTSEKTHIGARYEKKKKPFGVNIENVINDN